MGLAPEAVSIAMSHSDVQGRVIIIPEILLFKFNATVSTC